MSYYNRPWQGFVEVSDLGGEWRRVSGALGSVEAGQLWLGRQAGKLGDVTEWRIVDLGHNVYESGIVLDGYARTREAYLVGAQPSVHILASERRRLLEESLREEVA